MEKINLREKLALFVETWSPHIIATLNGQLVKLAKLDGEFTWHSHAEEDELFLVIEGELIMQLRDEEIHLQPGELCVVPRGVEHNPRTGPDGASILLFEPESTKNTGDVINERTVHEPRWI